MKRGMCLLLTCCMIVGMFPGCGKNTLKEEEDLKNESIETDMEDLRDITVAYWTLFNQPEEAALVEEAINAITEEKIGVTVHLNITDIGTYLVNGGMVNGVTNKEDYDLVLTTPAMSGHFVNMRNNGMLLPLNELLEEYGQGILETVPEKLLTATINEDTIYAVPAYTNFQKTVYYCMKREVAEACEIDIESIKTLDDIEDVLGKVKETFPEKNPISGGAQKLNIFEAGFSVIDEKNYDSLGDSGNLMAVFFDDDTYTVRSWYETEQFKEMAEYAKRWYEKGYVYKDLAIDASNTDPFADSDVNASSFYFANDSLIEQYKDNHDFVYTKIMDAGVQTSDVQMFTWALPVSCDEEEAAMKFLDLMYTEEEVLNLLAYGVEGMHYVEKDDGTIGFPEGIEEASSGYFLGTALVTGFGNAFLLKVWEGAEADSKEKELEKMEDAMYSPLMGFTLDTTEIGDLYGALTSIALNEYGPFLKSGNSPEGYYDEFITKLYDAGLQEYLDEANRQLKEWMETKYAK